MNKFDYFTRFLTIFTSNNYFLSKRRRIHVQKIKIFISFNLFLLLIACLTIIIHAPFRLFILTYQKNDHNQYLILIFYYTIYYEITNFKVIILIYHL